MENTGCITLNPASETVSQKTFVVIGMERSGTSMAAQLLHQCGVFMGAGLGATYENPFFSNKLRALHNTRNPAYLDEIAAEIARLNEAHGNWGWKFPSLVFPRLYETLRNPRLIFVFRDHVAIAKRMTVSGRLSFPEALKYVAFHQRMITEYALITRLPALLVSYEKAIFKKDTFLREFLAFIDLPDAGSGAEELAACVTPSPKAYLDFSKASRIEGNIDRIGPQIIGWVRDSKDTGRRLTVLISLDGEAHAVTADHFRKDVLDVGFGDGNSGFFFDVPERFLDGKPHALVIAVEGEKDARIGGAPEAFQCPAGAS